MQNERRVGTMSSTGPSDGVGRKSPSFLEMRGLNCELRPHETMGGTKKTQKPQKTEESCFCYKWRVPPTKGTSDKLSSVRPAKHKREKEKLN